MYNAVYDDTQLRFVGCTRSEGDKSDDDGIKSIKRCNSGNVKPSEK